jgi:hypothetical protein
MELPGYQLGDLLHEGQHSRVWRGLDETGGAVIIRVPAMERPGPREQARYQRAFELGQLADSRAVVRHVALVRHRTTLALVTEDFDGQSLEHRLTARGLDLRQLLELSVWRPATARVRAQSIPARCRAAVRPNTAPRSTDVAPV